MKLKLIYRIALSISFMSISFISICIKTNKADSDLELLKESSFHSSMMTTVGGTVYREFNFNGSADSEDNYRFEEVGYKDVTVNIYDDDLALLGTTLTDVSGLWSYDASAASGSQVLLEFVPPSGFDSGPSGNNNSTATTIATLGSMNNDFTIGINSDHCQDNPTIATACFPGPGASGPNSTIVTIDYNESSDYSGSQNIYPPTVYSGASASTDANIADEGDNGFVFGLAWDRTHNQILSSSYMKLTSAGMLNNTMGHIYTTSPNGSSGTTSLWLDLEAVPGLADIAGSSEYGDGTGTSDTDQDVHNIGYIGFTDIEIAADDSEVYVFNAHDRKVYIIPVNSLTGDADISNISSVEIPAICSGTNGNGFPYTAAGGLGVYDGKVYASVTCTGPSVSDLKGAIYSFDPSITSPVPVQEFMLDYASWIMPGIYVGGISGFTGGTFLNNELSEWSEGLSSVNPFLQTPNGAWVSGTGGSDFAPWAMDIEFDIHPNGTVGMNIITKNRAVDATQTFNDPSNGGYMTKAALNTSGGWTLESSGVAESYVTGLISGSPSNTNILQRGQVDAAFYHGEGLEGPSANGGAVIIPGFKEIMTSNTDNYYGNFDSGFSFHNVLTGLKTRDVNILAGSNVGFAKGNSWGDLQAMCESPPIEIGNYVWIDKDADGIQDPNESPQSGVDVMLFKDTDSDGVGDLFLGTARTDSEGYYFFGGAGNVNTSQKLAASMKYELRISLDQTQTVNNQIKSFTTPDNTLDKFDSDYRDTLIAGNEWAYVCISTDNENFIYHDLDVGLNLVPVVTINDIDVTCGPVSEGGSMMIETANFIGSPLVYDWDEDTYDGLTSISNVPLGTYTITVTDPMGNSVTAIANISQEACTPNPCQNGQMGGTVFNDPNADGIDDGHGGFQTVKVQIFECNPSGSSELIETTYTDSNGEYFFNNVSIVSGINYRIEFSNLPEGCTSSIEGVDNGTETQFVNVVSCDVDYGVINPLLYCQQNPMMVTPCYVSTTATNQDVLIRFSYENEGTAAQDKISIAESQMTGALWGVAYGRNERVLYTSAVLKGHIPMGPNGLDAIYSIDPFADDPNAAPWLELTDDLGIAVSDIIAHPQYLDNTARGLDLIAQNDEFAFQDVGKVGIGDIELSEDEKTLYIVNLYDKTLYAISTITKQLIASYPITEPSCSMGNARPWALAERNGKIYIGVTCDGSNSGDPSNLYDNSGAGNLSATIYRLDGTSFTEVLSFPLDYEREEPFHYSDFCKDIVNWKPWISVMPATCADGNVAYPTPLLTDIEFADNGDMILGFTDRTGFQFGYENYGPIGTSLHSHYSGGDILMACKNETGWEIENVISACSTNGQAINAYDNEGYNIPSNSPLPKEGEFFEGDYFHGDGGTDGNGLSYFPGHPEITIGGLAIVPGTGEVISTSYDPVTGAPNYNTGGVIFLDLETGKRSRNGYQIYETLDGNTTLGKGIGLGDLEALCDLAPLQLGNYVWVDTNADGIQDPCEEPVENLTVKIYTKPSDGGEAQLVATTSTNEEGEYYFSSSEDTDEVWEDGFTKIEKDSSYYIVFCGDNYNNVTNVISQNGNLFSITNPNTGMGDNPDFNDSDVLEIDIPGLGEFPTICVTVDSINHTFDLGLEPKPDVALTQVIDPSFDPVGISYGDSVKFKITVYNQSLGSIDSLKVTDYIPSGYTFDDSIPENLGWIEDANGNPELTITNNILPGEKDSVCIYLRLEKVTNTDQWINVVEISAAYVNGLEIVDCDSPLNNVADDNVGSEINTPADDYIFGNGTATEQNGVAETDQDNVDPATLPICDLALINKIDDAPLNITLGDTIKFSIIIENQGTVDATNIDITYTIPLGFDYLDINNASTPMWSETTEGALATIANIIKPGEKDTVCIYLEVDNVSTMDASINSWTTIAEISKFENPNNLGVPKLDFDSTPDDDPSNDSGGNTDDDTDDQTGGDGSGDPLDPIEDKDPELDEDDHDAAIIYVCDAAAKIITEDDGPFEYLDVVKYKVIVYNQGNDTITNIKLNNDLGQGLIFMSSIVNSDEGWSGDNDKISTMISSLMAPGESDTICLELQLVSTEAFDSLAYVQFVEIESIEDPNDPGLSKADIDSTADNDPDNDSGGNYNDITDDYIDGSGQGDPNDPIKDGDETLDEDDHDPVFIPIFDLALDKKVKGSKEIYKPGEKVIYEITVYNQGNVTAQNIKITDYMRSGFSFSNVGNSGWSSVGANLEYSSIASLAPNQEVTIELELTVVIPANPMGVTDWWNFAEISFADDNSNINDPNPIDADSYPDNIENNDNTVEPGGVGDDEITQNGKEGEDQDDHDPAAILVGYDLALSKTVSPSGPYTLGDTLTYTISIENQGGLTVSNISVYDTIPCGLGYVNDNDVDWNYANNVATTTISNLLGATQSISRDLLLVVQKCNIPAFDNYYNTAEIFDFDDENGNSPSSDDIDSTPDIDPNNDIDPVDNETNENSLNGGDEDDHDYENIEICDLALKNQIVEVPSQPKVGDSVKYEVIIYNQGNTIANSVSVNYSIPNGLGYLPVNNSLTPTWNEESSDLVSITTEKILMPNQKDTVCLYLEIMDLATDQASTESWTTYAEITEFTDGNDQPKTDDFDSTPDEDFTNDPGGNPNDATDNEIDGSGAGDPNNLAEDMNPDFDEDDHDPANIYVCDVAAIINTDEVGPFSYGDTLKYFVEIHNQGNGDIANISLQNLYGEGLEFIEGNLNSDAGWNKTSSGILTNLIEESIAPNDTLTVCLYMKLIPDYESSEGSWLQNLEVVSFEDPSAPGIAKHDVDSTPDDDPDNDSGGNSDDETDDETNGDGSGDPNDPNEDEDPNLDEDDQDTEDIEVCDLALKNSIVDLPSIPKVGDTVKYEVVIYNQGNAISNSVNIDYSLPMGLIYLPVNDDALPSWNMESSSLLSVQTNQILNPGASDTLCLYLEIDNVSTSDAHSNLWLTQAEITSFTDEDGIVKLEDIDSLPDDDFDNDSGGNPDDDTNDIVNGNGLGDTNDPNEDSDPNLDEDDNDATIIYLCDAAAIIYTLDETEHNYGDTIKYFIEVHNQGNGGIQNIVVQNSFGEGLLFPQSKFNVDTGWALDNVGIVSMVIDELVAPGDTIVKCIEMVLIPDHFSDDESWLQQIEIVQFEDPNDPGIAKYDIDSTPDDDVTNDSGGNSDDATDDVTDGDGTGDPNDPLDDGNPLLDEDDSDPVDTKVFDLALKMEIDSMPPVLPVVPGDIMKFIIVVYNQGNTVANDIELTNYLMDDNLFMDAQSKSDGWNEISSTVNKFVLTEELEPGESDTTCIYLQLINGAMSDIITWAEISGSEETDGVCYDIDSTPNDVNGDDVGGESTNATDNHIFDDGTDYNQDGITDEDDHDPAMLNAQDLALIVWADQKDPVVTGDDVKFFIRVINQGNIANHNIKIANYIPDGFELSSADTNNWNLETNNIYTKTLDNVLLMGDSVETCIILKVKEGVNAYDLINYAEIVSSTDSDGLVLDDRDVDSNPDSNENNDSGGQFSDLIDCEVLPIVIGDDNNTSGAGRNDEDEDDHDPAWVPVLDLASIIYTEHTQPLIPGDDIKFTVDVINQGNMGTENIGLTIYLPDGFYLSPEDSNGWIPGIDGTLVNILEDPLNPLDLAQLCLILRVDDGFTLLDLIPFVEINSVMDTLGNNRDDFDLDSEPDFDIENDVNGLDNFITGNGMVGNDEDDHDPVVPPIMDLAIQIINTDSGPKVPGDVVKFQVSVYNQGSLTPSLFQIENYLPEGLIFNDSADNLGWDLSGDNPIYNYTDKLMPLESDTICIWLEVADIAHPLNVTNMVEIISIMDKMGDDVSDRDIDSVSDKSNENDKGNDLYSAEDNKLEENGRSGDDEDDHDQAYVLLCQEMICQSNVNISLDENCAVELTPGMFLKGDLFPAEFYEYTYVDDFGVLQNIDSFGISDVNKSYTLKVSNPICSNSCWSVVTVEYKLPPQLDCPEDLTISCGGLDILGLPIAEAACAGLAFEVTLHNEIRERLDCDPDFTHRIIRTYRATDEMGNFAECSHEIFLQRVDLTSIMFPEWRTQSMGNAISCSDKGFIFDEDGYPLPWLNANISGPISSSGVPFICDSNVTNGVLCPLTGSGAAPLIPIGGATDIDEDGNVIIIEGEANQICNSAILYTDLEQFSTECTRKIIRTWEVREWWCSGENSAGGIQMIEVIDDEAPTFDCPNDFTVTTNDDCAGSVVLDSIVAVDNCMNGIIVSIDYPNGLLKSNGGVAELDTGINMIKYIVADGCYNKDSCFMQVTVVDKTEPVAICERNTVVSISPTGMTEVFAEVFDDGSWDECSSVAFEVRRMDTLCVAADTLFGKSISFCCLDVPNDDLMVVFRAYDHAGNFNDCMVNVDVQDKVIASMECPEQRFIDCREPFDLANLTLLYGAPDISDNCAATQVVIETVNADSIDQCGLGKIIRLFELMDETGNEVLKTCKQIIYINNGEPFVQDSIAWPKDIILPDGCNAGDAHPDDLIIDPNFASNAYPIINGDSTCSLIGWDWDDRVISTTAIAGECVVIERTWTVINWCGAVSGSFETFVSPSPQIITVTSSKKPILAPAEDSILIESINIDCESGLIRIERNATDECSTNDLIWSYLIKDVANNIVAVGDTNVLLDTLTNGTYTVEWEVTNQCNFKVQDTQTIEVVNLKAPTPVCNYGLNVTLTFDNTGGIIDETAEIWASDLDAGSYHTCGNPITISLSKDSVQLNRKFTCADKGEQTLQLWVRDTISGVQDFCTSLITVTDNGNCPDMNRADIQGEIYTESLEMVHDVEINLVGSEETYLTQSDGNYYFNNMPMGGDYIVNPYKDIDHLEGVSTLDLILIQRHILGIQRLNSPYKLIAADIDRSNDISVNDLLELRKLILGIKSNFTDNTSWRFIDADYDFLDEANPWVNIFPEDYEIGNLSRSMDIDFIGVKTGDVNETITSKSRLRESSEAETALNFSYYKTDIVKEGKVTIPIYSSNYNDISGWQSTFRFDTEKIEVVDIVSGELEMNNHFNLANQKDGWFTVSYYQKESMSVSNDDILFSIVVKAKENIRSENLFELSSSIIRPEAYVDYSTVINLELKTLEELSLNETIVYPNPWSERTVIEFMQSIDSEVTLTFYNSNGELIYKKSKYCEKGVQRLKIERSEINTSGMLFVIVSNGKSSSEFKMMIID